MRSGSRSSNIPRQTSHVQQVDPLEHLRPTTCQRRKRDNVPRKAANVKISFVGANPHPRIEPFDRLDTVVSYFIGNDPDQWRPDVPVWGGVRYVDLYPGVDLELTSEGGQMVQRLATRARRRPERGAAAGGRRPTPWQWTGTPCA